MSGDTLAIIPLLLRQSLANSSYVAGFLVIATDTKKANIKAITTFINLFHNLLQKALHNRKLQEI